MWHIFFDLDLTLICRRDATQHPSKPQLTNISQHVIGNLSTGATNQYNPTDPICSPIYQQQHTEFFEHFARNAAGKAKLFFISAGDYPEIKTKTILKMFFARSESSQHLIDNAGYFERNDLLPFANIDYDKTPEAERITAMAEAKAMMMQLQSGEFASANSGQSISPLNVILIDDEPANRQAVLKKYFQVINPCAASYTARLQTLQSLIPSGMHRFIKDDQDRPRKTLSELMQSLEI